ncbi:MAG: hypothetical protein Q4A70_04230 [Candidatus Saccharibacteria bacterium]|nr:hypothetical protein [Candidatus Saccharibacteria bacterium]
MCYELSVVVMILLKGHKSARICRGIYHDKKQGFISRHSWVEVKVPLNGWYVVDLAWMYPAFCGKKNYWQHKLEGDLVCEWICKYKDFWKIRFPNILREAMQNSLTSHVLLEFSVFGNPDEGYEFDPILHELDKLRFTDGQVMIPFLRDCSDNPISSKILREFVVNPKREQPKAKSIRRANAAIKMFWTKKEAVL